MPTDSGISILKKLTHIWSRARRSRITLDSEPLQNQAQRALVLVKSCRLMTLFCLRADDQGRDVASTVGRITGFAGTVDVDNIVRELIAAGKTWKSYAESIPSTGYTGSDVYPYAKRHNPFSYFTDVVNSSVQLNNLVSFSQFGSDLANQRLPNFSFLAPNLLDDAHDGPLQLADAWLQHNLAPLISSSTFQKDGLLVIVFDEAETNHRS